MEARSFHTPKDYLDLANSPDVTPAELRSLADSPYRFVHHVVASNPATPPDVLRRLVPTPDGADDVMLRILARNPASPEDVLRKVARQVPSSLRRNGHDRFGLMAGMALFERPDAPGDMLLDLLRNLEATRNFRRGAARRTIHAAILEELSHDRSERVRRTAQKRLAELR